VAASWLVHRRLRLGVCIVIPEPLMVRSGQLALPL
jgi:hypothetical protein